MHTKNKRIRIRKSESNRNATTVFKPVKNEKKMSRLQHIIHQPGACGHAFALHVRKWLGMSARPFSLTFELAQKQLSGYKQSKSAVNFPLDEPVPAKLIGRMSKFQAEDIGARTKGKSKGGVKIKPKAAKKKT
jgi:hypothetical protein